MQLIGIHNLGFLLRKETNISMVNVLKFQTKLSDKMIYANSADPDQTAPEEQSDQCLHCLPFHLLSKYFKKLLHKAKFSPN